MRNKPAPEIVELSIDAAGFEGVCVSRYDNKVVFTKYTVPGDVVLAGIVKNKKKFFEAKVDKILQNSPDRIEPKCKHFGICGGCSWQSMSYEKQLFWKNTNVKDVFERIGKVDVGEFRNIIGAENQFGYRNKMEFSFGGSRWLTDEEIKSGIELERKDFAFGLHLPGRFDKIIDIESCEIQSDYANLILQAIRKYTEDNNLSAYNARTHEGFLRGLIIRYSLKNDNYMTIMMTKTPRNDEEKEFLNWYQNGFADAFPQVANLVYAINESKNPVTVSEVNVLRGNGFMTEEILGVEFRISPFSFFQTNSYQLNKFISLIIESAGITNNMNVWDLYCGTGSITLPAAKFARKITGIEIVESSILDARENAELNQIKNADFICADLHNKKIPDLLFKLEKPDIVICDPPRAGMNTNLISHLLEIAPKRILYVSCNPATQARDCSLLSEKYSIESVQPVDMFPHTYHIESIAVLNLKA
jgi:23S rRNA (uracil1939-C5)-methyltransferase